MTDTNDMKDKCDCQGHHHGKGYGKKHKHHGNHGASASGIWFLGFIGAAVYYISTATGFWVGALGLLKAIVWPGFLVYEALKALGA